MAQSIKHPAFTEQAPKKKFYITEILMLKSIVVLLILTFFLLNEMQASNNELNSLKKDITTKQLELENDALLR